MHSAAEIVKSCNLYTFIMKSKQKNFGFQLRIVGTHNNTVEPLKYILVGKPCLSLCFIMEEGCSYFNIIIKCNSTSSYLISRDW